MPFSATVGCEHAESEFDYWEPMFYQAMPAVRFGDWWAEALGVDWAERTFEEP